MNVSKPIKLEFTPKNARMLLSMGAHPKDSLYSHKQIAEWCDRFWCKYLDMYDLPKDIEKLLPILTDVEIQWELYLANTYSFQQLQEESFEHIVLPVEWFEKWARDARKGHNGTFVPVPFKRTGTKIRKEIFLSK